MDKEMLLRLLASSEMPEKENPLLGLIAQLSAFEENEKVIDLDEYVSNLQHLNTSIKQKHVFKLGDVVCWKAGLKNKKVPNYKLPAIVMEILENPIFDEKAEVGSPYFREPLDFILGVIIKGELLTFHYDSRRFEPFEKK